MNKELRFVEMLEDDITRGSATLSLVRGQFNDTGLARGKCRIFPTQRHTSHITATSHGTMPTGTLRILVTDRKRSEDTLYTRLPRLLLYKRP